MFLIYRCRSSSNSELFYSVISLNAIAIPCVLISLSVMWFSEHYSSVVCPLELSCLSEVSFMITLTIPKQSSQVYIHSGACKWGVYSNRSVFD